MSHPVWQTADDRRQTTDAEDAHTSHSAGNSQEMTPIIRHKYRPASPESTVKYDVDFSLRPHSPHHNGRKLRRLIRAHFDTFPMV